MIEEDHIWDDKTKTYIPIEEREYRPPIVIFGFWQKLTYFVVKIARSWGRAIMAQVKHDIDNWKGK